MACKIEIPAAYAEGAAPYWKLAAEHGQSREDMVRFICSFPSYRSFGATASAISFNVKLYGLDLSPAHLWATLYHSGEINKEMPRLRRARQLFTQQADKHKNMLYEWAVEDAWESWAVSDTPYETWLGERIDWKFGLQGRSGGHFCMFTCGSVDLRCSSLELEELLNDRDGDGEFVVPDAEVRSLFIICAQLKVELTPRNVCNEVEHHAAMTLWSQIEEAFEAESKQLELREADAADEPLKRIFYACPAELKKDLIELAHAAGRPHPLPVGARLVSLDGETDEADPSEVPPGQPTERHTGPKAAGRVDRVEVHGGLWSYSVAFPNGTSVWIDERDMLSGAYEW